MKRAKEKLEDIDVMDGIDFEKNQRRIQRLNDRIRKQKILNRIFYTLAIILIILVLIIIFNKVGEKGYKGCLEKGYSETFCRQHL